MGGWINTEGYICVEWEILVYLQTKNMRKYANRSEVTGSNSKMLSTDVMTEFKDRGDEIHVNPLTYKEFYSAYQGDKSHAWADFVTYGGLPRVMALKSDREKSQYLHDLIRKTYLTDVIERNKDRRCHH